jgi:hypothetical protein
MIGELLIHGIVFFVMVFLFATTYSFPNLNIGGKLGPAGGRGWSWGPERRSLCFLFFSPHARLGPQRIRRSLRSRA